MKPAWRKSIHTLVGMLFLTSVCPLSLSLAQEAKPLEGHKEAVAAVAYSPDGRFLATGSFDKTIKLWDTATFKEIKSFEGHTDLVLTLAFSPDGRQLISGSQDNTAKVWSLPSDKESKLLPAVAGAIRSLAVSPDGTLLVSASDDGKLRINESATGNAVKELSGHQGPVYAAVFTGDGKQLYSTGADRNVRVWDVASGQLQISLEVGTQPATTLDILANNQALFTGTSTGVVQRWNLPLQPTKTLAGHAEAISKLRLHPNATQIVSVGADNSLHLHDLAGAKEVLQIKSPAAILDYSILPGNPALAATAGADGAIRVWNLADGKQVNEKGGFTSPPTGVAFLPDGKTILVGSADGSLQMVAYPFVADVTVRAQVVHPQPITAFASSADGEKILTASADSTVRIWDAQGNPIRAFALFSPITSATINAAGTHVAAVAANGTLVSWELSGREIQTIPGVASPVALSADGQWVAFAKADNKVYVAANMAGAEAKAVATHAAAVKAIAFSPDGKLLVSGGDDKSVKIADIAQAKEIHTLAGHGAGVLSLAISTDGSQIASGGADNQVILWTAADGKEAGKLAVGGAVNRLSYTAGAQLIVSSADNKVRVFEANAVKQEIDTPTPLGAVVDANGQLLTASADGQLRFVSKAAPAVLGKHAAKITALAISPDGKLLLSASEDKLVRIWDLATKKPVRDLAHEGAVLSLAISADNTKLLTGSADKHCRVWNLADGSVLLSLPATNAVHGLDISRDGKRIAFASTDNIARIHDIAGAELQSYTVGGLSGVAFAGDGKSVVTSSADKVLRQETLVEGWIQQEKGAVTALVVTPNGTRVIAAAENSVSVRDANNGAVLKSIPIPAPAALSVAADNARLAIGSGDKSLHLADLNNGTVLQQFPVTAAALTGASFSKDMKYIATCSADGTISLWTTPQGKTPGELVQSFARPAPATSVTFLHDNKTLAAASGDKAIRYFELPPPAMVNLPGHKSQVYAVAFSPDGLTAVSGSADKTIIVWDLKGAKPAKTLTGHEEQVYDVAFSPDGKQLISAGGDKKVLVWDLATDKPIKTLTGSADALYRIAYIDGGAKVIAAGVDKVIRVWDLASGMEERKFEGQPDEIYGLSLSADGKTLVTSGYAGNLMIWDVATGKAIHEQKLNFGAFDVDYAPGGASVAVANNDAKVYLVTVPATVKDR